MLGLVPDQNQQVCRDISVVLPRCAGVTTNLRFRTHKGAGYLAQRYSLLQPLHRCQRELLVNVSTIPWLNSPLDGFRVLTGCLKTSDKVTKKLHLQSCRRISSARGASEGEQRPRRTRVGFLEGGGNGVAMRNVNYFGPRRADREPVCEQKR